MARIQDLMQKRAKAVADARAILDRADAEGRSAALNTEEQSAYDAALADEARCAEAIKREEDLAAREAQVKRTHEPVRDKPESRDDAAERRAEWVKTLRPELRQALEHCRGDARMAPEYEQTFRAYLRGEAEARDLQADNLAKGGAILAPQTFVARMIQAADNALWIRSRATVIPCGLAGLGAASLDADPEDGDWTAELTEADLDTAMTFGRRELKPGRISKAIKVSNDLLGNALMDVESIVAARFGYKFGVTEEKAFLTGSGAKQPLGLFTASNDGIPTGRDVSTDNTSTAMTYDGLVNAKYAVKVSYHRSCSWIFHRDGMKQLVKIKDGEGNYMWRGSVALGEPDTLFGHPVLVSEYAPNTFTSGLYVGLFGDLSNYWIADAMDMSLQRLNEKYALSNQTAWIARRYVDGAPVLAEAFSRVKLG